jgi:putative peptidoglycan lipid II flippase
LLAAALWLTARFVAPHLPLHAFRSEIVLLLLIAVGGAVYAVAVLSFFGPKWLRSLVRS